MGAANSTSTSRTASRSRTSASWCRDRGLVVADVIGFAEWIVDDDARRRKGFEEAKRIMGMCQEVGCKHMAAPPAGAGDHAAASTWAQAAERYAELCKLGESMGVDPALEMWGFSKNIRRLGEAVQVAMESGARKPCVLPDVYHFYKGGSNPTRPAVAQQGCDRASCTSTTTRTRIGRRSPTPTASTPATAWRRSRQIFGDLRAIGYRGMLSLELFNRDYWQKDALAVAVTGMEKMKAAVGGLRDSVSPRGKPAS